MGQVKILAATVQLNLHQDKITHFKIKTTHVNTNKKSKILVRKIQTLKMNSSMSSSSASLFGSQYSIYTRSEYGSTTQIIQNPAQIQNIYAENRCSICLENFNELSYILEYLPCHHEICWDCTKQIRQINGCTGCNVERNNIFFSIFNRGIRGHIHCPLCREVVIDQVRGRP